MPSSSLIINARRGIKKYKDRITILLCVNMSGTDKRKPFIIGKSKNPRVLKQFNYSAYCEYCANKSAWMTSIEFGNWIMRFDNDLIMEKK